MEKGNEREEDEFNQKMRKAWERSRGNWRQRRPSEEPQSSEIVDPEDQMIYSPEKDTEEGKEKEERRKKLKSAENLKRNWLIIRECKAFLTENEEKWEKRTRDEIRKIREEEKTRRLERVAEKKKKYGLKTLKKHEEEDLKRILEMRLELAEVKKNLWRRYRDEKGNEIPFNEKKRKNSEKEEEKEKVAPKYMPMSDYFAKVRDERKEKARKLKEKWEELRSAVEYIEDEEDLLVAEWLERENDQKEIDEKVRKAGEKDVKEPVEKKCDPFTNFKFAKSVPAGGNKVKALNTCNIESRIKSRPGSSTPTRRSTPSTSTSPSSSRKRSDLREISQGNNSAIKKAKVKFPDVKKIRKIFEPNNLTPAQAKILVGISKNICDDQMKPDFTGKE